METSIPWQELCDTIEPFYPKPRDAQCRPIHIERTLRSHCLQHRFHFAAPAAEDALYDSHALHHFVDFDLGQDSALDETTICKFRLFAGPDQIPPTCPTGKIHDQ